MKNEPALNHQRIELAGAQRTRAVWPRAGAAGGRPGAFHFFALMVFCPLLAFAGVQWHEFGRSPGDVYPIKVTIAIGDTVLVVDTQTNSASGFPGDDLSLTVRRPGQKAQRYDFTSTYGFGAVAIHGDLLLLKYGVGRGTGARTDHVKALRLDDGLAELADVQSSCHVLTDPHNAAADLFEYRLEIQSGHGYKTLTFSLPKRQRGIPSEKIVRIKNDAGRSAGGPGQTGKGKLETGKQ